MIQGVLENKAVVSKYLYLKVVDDEGMEQCERYDRTIESFSPYNRQDIFEFKTADLSRVFQLLRFPVSKVDTVA